MGFLLETAEIFLQDAPRQLAALQEAMVQQDATRFERAAHSLKGAVSNFDAKAVFQAAQRLELLGKSGDLATAKQELATFETVFGELCQALAQLTES